MAGQRAPYLVKVKKVTKQLGVKYDDTSRPFQTVRELKEFRDTLAHGKPVDLHNDKEVITTQEELDKRGFLTPDWHSSLNEAFVTRAFDDSDTIWRDLLSRAKLDIFDTITQGESSITFIEHVTETTA